MYEQLIQGIVCILDGNRHIAGTGFVISESGLIATCSHVIQHESLQQDGTPRPERVTVVFHGTGDEQDAQVESDWWLPWNAGDLAILRTEGTLPQGVQPLALGSAQGTNGHEICTFGFPDLGSIEGLGGDGRVVRVLRNEGRLILQLRSNEITAGFSGAPLWDKSRRRVIGMVSAIAEPDPHHRLVETAFAVSTETLRTTCPVLRLSEVCPYRGLAAFTEADAEFFFGQQQLLEGLLSRLRRNPRFLVIVGASGSGKSSVVQAGLIPQLRSGKVSGSDRWGIIVMRPATQPFDELTRQGLADTETSHDLTAHVQAWLNRHAGRERLMLVIDQFEELLSLCPEDIRQDFIAQVAKLLRSPLPITVVLVMRDDFYSRLIQQETLVEWLEQSHGPIHVPKLLKQEELLALVQKPAEAVGLRWEEGLVETIVKETLETSLEAENGDRVGRSVVLPLVEFALTELWKHRQEGMLTHEAYRNLGGVAGALTQWADRAFYGLKNAERQLAQRILLNLVYVGDKDQGALDSRRRRTLRSLCRDESEQASVYQVLQPLVENRLLTTDRDLQSNEETVEIIHDTLLQKWGELQGWLEQDRRFLTWRQEFERHAQRWTNHHDVNKLLRGRDLTEAKGWLKEREADLSRDEVRFLGASVAHRVSFVIRMIAVLLLIALLTGTTGWYYLRQAPDPRLVTNLDDDGVGSLRWSVANTLTGGTITFAPALFAPNVMRNIKIISGNIIVTKQITIRGPGRERLTVSSGSPNFGIQVVPKAFLTIEGLSLGGSQLTPFGSIIGNQGTLTVNNCTFSYNRTDASGGGIENYDGGAVTVNNCIFSDNVAAADGGAIYNISGGTVIVNNSTFSGNVARVWGGAIYNDQRGRLTVSNSTFSGNSAQFGGGIYNDRGTVTVSNSTFSGNMATVSNGTLSADVPPLGGGGIENYGGMLTASNSTFYGNSAEFGGGMDFSFDRKGVLDVTPFASHIIFCTIFGNTASQKGSGGGIYMSSKSKVAMASSIVAANHAPQGADIEGPLLSEGYNLIENFAGASFDMSGGMDATDRDKQQYGDLKIDSVLGDNGGNTQTLKVYEGSPAVDIIPLVDCKSIWHIIDNQGKFIMNMSVTTDQRGVKRPQRAACDIGAYELER